ncbi:hypothetical protein HOQ52_gp05 [uncultured phage_MedDCM-OCT-S30-C28]|uniref:Uncharacterized protein n=1 Tax=uncultured phage_MedDCM-OCT-S30-C28 TaxID=2741076 RepID=A0A6S4P7T3_9CAUD|nr:hypothetical protein HOQ52_gp05 [uncultured phage_MedDCM-OCT-S30-C28]BAQ94201.1 hypothetical protein [uncultured phage_MedDCM-OCT-S30-C28]
MNSKKYKSVAIKIGTWNVATDLSQKIVPNTTLSRSKIVEIAVARLARSLTATNTNNIHKVSFQKLIATKG